MEGGEREDHAQLELARTFPHQLQRAAILPVLPAAGQARRCPGKAVEQRQQQRPVHVGWRSAGVLEFVGKEDVGHLVGVSYSAVLLNANY